MATVRYVVKPAINSEVKGRKSGELVGQTFAEFQIMDTEEDRRLPEVYPDRQKAQKACDCMNAS